MNLLHCFFCRKYVGKIVDNQTVWEKTKIVKGLTKMVRLCDYRCGSGTFVKMDGTQIQDIK